MEYERPCESLSEERCLYEATCLGHVHSEQVTKADLRDVVGDVLVVLQIGVGHLGRSWCGGHIRLAVMLARVFCVSAVTTHHHAASQGAIHAFGVLPLARSRHTFTPGRMEALRLGVLACRV